MLLCSKCFYYKRKNMIYTDIRIYGYSEEDTFSELFILPKVFTIKRLDYSCFVVPLPVTHFTATGSASLEKYWIWRHLWWCLPSSNIWFNWMSSECKQSMKVNTITWNDVFFALFFCTKMQSFVGLNFKQVFDSKTNIFIINDAKKWHQDFCKSILDTKRTK